MKYKNIYVIIKIRKINLLLFALCHFTILDLSQVTFGIIENRRPIMKRKLWLFLFLLTCLCLFAACAGPGPEPQPDPVPPPEERVEPRLEYTFPPDEAQLKQVLDDLELD